MPDSLALTIVAVVAYLIGAVPFGYVVGRMKGKDLFREGSGNIGATNVGRVLGRTYGIAVFVLDFLKGALPTLAAHALFRTLAGHGEPPFGYRDLDTVAAAAASFLGHLFPVYLKFRGGKGVATGAGAALIVAPLPAVLAVLAWITVVLASRMVSLASLMAAVVIICTRILFHLGIPMEQTVAGTLFCTIGGFFVVVKHRANVQRIVERTENRIAGSPGLLAGWHALALAFGFGGAAFFNFLAAPAIFASFETVVATQPSHRTAGQRIQSETATDAEKKALASALSGAAVGPIFPKYFALLTVTGLIGVVTAIAWHHRGRVHRWRTAILMAALVMTVIGWPLSGWVSQLRLDRFAEDAAVAANAKSLFGPVHLVSLAMSALGTLLSGIGLLLAGWIPREE